MKSKKRNKKTKRARSTRQAMSIGNTSERQAATDEDSSRRNDLPVIDPT
jgi:hypothetical protein